MKSLDKLKAEMAMGFPPTSAAARLLIEETEWLREALERETKRAVSAERVAMAAREHQLARAAGRPEAMQETFRRLDHKLVNWLREKEAWKPVALSEEPQR